MESGKVFENSELEIIELYIHLRKPSKLSLL